MSLWFAYSYFVVLPNRELINSFYLDYTQNLISSPIKYRVFLTEIVIKITAFLKINNYVLIYEILMFAVFNFSIYQLVLFFTKVINKPELLLSAIFLSYIFIVISFTYHFYQPWSYLDIGIYSFCYTSLFFKKKYSFNFFLIYTVALLNRETGIFIALLYLIHSVVNDRNKKSLIKAIILLAYGISVLVLLRYYKGYQPSSDFSNLKHIFTENILPVNLLIYMVILISSGILFIPFLKTFDKRFKSAYINILFFLPMYLVYGIWVEIRMLLPFLPLLVLPLSQKMLELFNFNNEAHKSI
jgi:hypothetical protein